MTSQRGTGQSSTGNPGNNADAQKQGEPRSVRDAYDQKKGK